MHLLSLAEQEVDTSLMDSDCFCLRQVLSEELATALQSNHIERAQELAYSLG